jgi:cytochrome c-type biogenesis protein
MLSYTTLAFTYYGASTFRVAKLFQGNGEKLIGPVMIIVGLIMLGVVKLNYLSKGNITLHGTHVRIIDLDKALD